MAFFPRDAAAACFRRCRRLLTLAGQDLPDPKIKNDLRRSALVVAVASIDAYMHWLVFRRLSDVRRKGDLPKALARVPVPFSELANLADGVITARRRNYRKMRPWVRVKGALQDQILKETFQSYEDIGNALALAGIQKGWSRISEILGIHTDEIKRRLGSIVHRRNQIVHEGDIARASRPRNLRYNKVDHDEVAACVDWVEELLAAIEVLAKEEGK